MENKYKGVSFSISRERNGFMIRIKDSEDKSIMSSGPFVKFETAFHLAIRWINETVWRNKNVERIY